MRTRLISFSIAICLLLSLIPTQLSAQSPAQTTPDDRPFVQGQVAYMLDDDIWLLNLNSGESRQLTDDGANRWPNWSPDGRYLSFTKMTNGGESFALYVWELDAEDEPRLLAEDACCGDWNPDGPEIVFVMLDKGQLDAATRRRRVRWWSEGAV